MSKINVNKVLSNRHYMKEKVADQNVIAFCHSLAHTGRLSEKLLKQHGCIGKNCPFLEKYNHQYWIEKDCINELKRYNKHNKNGFIKINEKYYKQENLKILVKICEKELEETGSYEIRYESTYKK